MSKQNEQEVICIAFIITIIHTLEIGGIMSKTRLVEETHTLKSFEFDFCFVLPDARETAIGWYAVIDFIVLRWSIFVGDLSIFVDDGGGGSDVCHTNKFIGFGSRFHIVRLWYDIFVIFQYGTFALEHIERLKKMRQKSYEIIATEPTVCEMCYRERAKNIGTNATSKYIYLESN